MDLELRKKRRKAEDERLRERRGRKRRHIKANEDEAGFYEGKSPSPSSTAPFQLRSVAISYHC